MDKPNILFMLADDLGWGDLSWHNSPIRTPNIDRLMRGGIELTQHYVCPVCTPTRASLMTGMYPGRFGNHATAPTNSPVLPDGYKTLASHLRDAGYDTGLFGKWHLGSKPEFCANNYGFNTSYGSLAGGVDPYNHHYKKGEFSRTWHRNGELIEENGHVTDLIADNAAEWIESREQPWFCYVPFTAVHVPVKAPSEWLSSYEFETYDYDAAKDLSFKRYAAYASHMDAAVGRLIDALQRSRQLENTIVVFSSDNGAISSCPIDESDKYPGWHWETPRLGSNLPFKGQKGQMYEGGVRTPAVLFHAGSLKPGKFESPMYIGDWLPSFVNQFGNGVDEGSFDGRDMWAALTGSIEKPEKRSIYWNLRNRVFSLRDGDWKLIKYTPECGGDIELYNIASDPYETKNLAPENESLVSDMLAKMEAERAKDNSLIRADME